jgi:O-phosphoseryl-tRNA(Cys) synthetase
MYIKTQCAHCGESNLHDIHVCGMEEIKFKNKNELKIFTIENISVKETITEENLIKSVLKTLLKYKKLYLEKEELTDILKNLFGVSSELAAEIVEKIKSENEALKTDFESSMKTTKKQVKTKL